MLVVKLGGSYITFKRSSSSVRFERDEGRRIYPVKKNVLSACAKVLRKHAKDGLIIVHGGGTHGHRTVMRWREGVARGHGPMMPWEVRRRMDELTSVVVRVLGEGGVPAYPVPPPDIMTSESGSISFIDPTPIVSFLERGMVPVLRGDLVPDVSGGWSVVSGDDIILRLADLARDAQIDAVDRVVMCMDVEAFYSSGPSVGSSRVPSIDAEAFHRSYSSWERDIDPARVDVSGGILKKLRTSHAIASKGIPVNLVGGDPQNIDLALAGSDVGTLFVPFQGPAECSKANCIYPGV